MPAVSPPSLKTSGPPLESSQVYVGPPPAPNQGKMVTSTHKPYIAQALGDVMRASLKKPETVESTKTQSGSFDSALSEATAAPVERFFVDGTPESRQIIAPPADSRQQAVQREALEMPITVGPDQFDRPPTIRSDTQNRHFSALEDPTPKVIAEMEKMGVSAAGVRFERWDEVVANWGGNYTNHLLKVDAGGRSENFSIELALRSPKVAAVEIMNLMGRTVIS